MVVDRFELMRERVHTRDGEPEVWIEFIGDSQSIGLKAETKKLAVTFI
jgi:hypothetical protein